MFGYGNCFFLPKSASGSLLTKSGAETGIPQPPLLEAHGLLRHSGHTSKNGTSGTRRGVHMANNCGISSSYVLAHVEALGATQSPKLKASGSRKNTKIKENVMFLGRPFVRDSQILHTSRSWSQTCLLYTYCHFTGRHLWQRRFLTLILMSPGILLPNPGHFLLVDTFSPPTYTHILS